VAHHEETPFTHYMSVFWYSQNNLIKKTMLKEERKTTPGSVFSFNYVDVKERNFCQYLF
jgi:hypothetical protein